MREVSQIDKPRDRTSLHPPRAGDCSISNRNDWCRFLLVRSNSQWSLLQFAEKRLQFSQTERTKPFCQFMPLFVKFVIYFSPLAEHRRCCQHSASAMAIPSSSGLAGWLLLGKGAEAGAEHPPSPALSASMLHSKAFLQQGNESFQKATSAAIRVGYSAWVNAQHNSGFLCSWQIR